jgi:hypothetical protein
MNIKRSYSHINPLYVFISPPALDVLAKRLGGRGSETEETMRARLSMAKGEVEYAAVREDRLPEIQTTPDISGRRGHTTSLLSTTTWIVPAHCSGRSWSRVKQMAIVCQPRYCHNAERGSPIALLSSIRKILYYKSVTQRRGCLFLVWIVKFGILAPPQLAPV